MFICSQKTISNKKLHRKCIKKYIEFAVRDDVTPEGPTQRVLSQVTSAAERVNIGSAALCDR